MYKYSACVLCLSIHVVPGWCPARSEGGVRYPGTVIRDSCVAVWIPGTQPRPSGRATRALNPRAISLGLPFFRLFGVGGGGGVGWGERHP